MQFPGFLHPYFEMIQNTVPPFPIDQAFPYGAFCAAW
jgi:hypothetical protein